MKHEVKEEQYGITEVKEEADGEPVKEEADEEPDTDGQEAAEEGDAPPKKRSKKQQREADIVTGCLLSRAEDKLGCDICCYYADRESICKSACFLALIIDTRYLLECEVFYKDDRETALKNMREKDYYKLEFCRIGSGVPGAHGEPSFPTPLRAIFEMAAAPAMQPFWF